MPPKLTVPERRAGRTRGKSDPIDALAIARAALREPDLSRPRPDEQRLPRDQAAGRSPRRSRRPAPAHPAAAALASLSARPDLRGAVADARPRLPPGARQPLARPAASKSCKCGSHASSSRAAARSTARSPSSTRNSNNASGKRRPALLELPGCAAVTAAKLLAEIGPIDRFKSDAQLARHSGVAPLEASSGRTQRHRLDRGGNRQLNAALYRIAITQARYHPAARDYLERKRAEGKSRREAIRCLKRLLIRVVFNTLKASPALT